MRIVLGKQSKIASMPLNIPCYLKIIKSLGYISHLELSSKQKIKEYNQFVQIRLDSCLVDHLMYQWSLYLTYQSYHYFRWRWAATDIRTTEWLRTIVLHVQCWIGHCYTECNRSMTSRCLKDIKWPDSLPRSLYHNNSLLTLLQWEN